jgi:hypothetical protein
MQEADYLKPEDPYKVLWKDCYTTFSLEADTEGRLKSEVYEELH